MKDSEEEDNIIKYVYLTQDQYNSIYSNRNDNKNKENTEEEH